MADAVTVHHVGPDLHGNARNSRFHCEQGNAEPLRGAVVGKQGTRGRLCCSRAGVAQCVSSGHRYFPGKRGARLAPKAATPEWYLERNMHAIPLTSAHAVSIPGAVDAWATILKDHGKLGLDALLQPAIKAAEEGYIVAPRIAFDWKNQFEKLKNGTNTERYLLPHGKPAGVCQQRRRRCRRTWTPWRGSRPTNTKTDPSTTR